MPAPIPRPQNRQKPLRIQPPELPAGLTDGDLQALLLQADADDEPLSGFSLSGTCEEDFYKTEIRFCRFDRCRLSGRLDRCYFRDCVFDSCDLSNVDFSGSTLRRVVFKGCKLLGAKLPEVRMDQVRFTDCHMRLANLTLCGASLFRTPLAGQDLTTDEITGIQVSLPELKGAVVTPYQACELAGLLGLIVKSE